MAGAEGARRLHLHIGLPKTASTFLQTRVFPELDHLIYQDRPRSELFRAVEDEEAEYRTFSSAFRRTPLIWREMGGRILTDLLGPPDSSDRRDMLISEEGIGRTGSRPDLLGLHLAALAEAMAPWGIERINVIVMIRRQDTWLASHYAQISDRKPRPSQEDFADRVAAMADPARDRYAFGMLLDYGALLERIAAADAQTDLTVLPHEELAEAPGRFLARLLGTLGTPPERADAIAATAIGGRANVRSDGASWRLRPPRGGGGLLGRVRRRGASFLPAIAPSSPGQIHLTPELSARLLAAYGEANRRAAGLTGIDLGRFGYFPAEGGGAPR